MTNSSLLAAQANADDEFYTPLFEIEHGLAPYLARLRGVRILLNTNDGQWSMFWQYLTGRFHELGLREVVSMEYNPDHGTLFAQPGDTGRVHHYDGQRMWVEDTHDNGGFDAPSGLDALRHTDVVLGNPPFTRLHDYVPLLLAAPVDWLIVANIHCVLYSRILPAFIQGQVQVRAGNRGMWFRLPEGRTAHARMRRVDTDGRPMVRVTNTGWLTNMPTEPAVFTPTHRYDPHTNPLYDTINAVDAPSRNLIPCDWAGRVGAPVSILNRWPAGYRPVGMLSTGHGPLDHGTPTVQGRALYKRILIEPGPWPGVLEQ